MYTRLHIPCRNTACLIYLFIVLVLCHDSFMFCGFCGWHNGTWFCVPAVSYQWILSPGLGLDPLLDWSLLYVQIVRHYQLTCFRGSCVHWCSGTSINDGTGFPDVLLN